MSPLLRLYLKTFVSTGFIFALFMMIRDYFEARDLQITYYILSLIFFGGIMSLALVTYHKHSLHKMGVTILNKENLDVEQVRELNSSINKQQLLELLTLDAYFGKSKIEEKENGIRIKTKINGKSWGEIIDIVISIEAANSNHFKISSKPRYIPQFVDYGKNLQNVMDVEKLIKS